LSDLLLTEVSCFQKDGTTVGSIGARVGDLYLGTGDVGITFTDSIDSIRPVDPSTTDLRDAAIDIGTGTARFKDLYLSGDIVINDQTNGATRKILFDMKNTGGAQSDFSLQANNGNFLFYSEAAATERARIDSSGNLLVGTTVSGTPTNGCVLYKDSTRGILKAATTLTATDAVASFYNPNGKVGQIVTSGTTTSYQTSSDQRLKENIADAYDAGSKVDAIQVQSV
jgi:osmotically-inducible protein OsmY